MSTARRSMSSGHWKLMKLNVLQIVEVAHHGSSQPFQTARLQTVNKIRRTMLLPDCAITATDFHANRIHSYSQHACNYGHHFQRFVDQVNCHAAPILAGPAAFGGPRVHGFGQYLLCIFLIRFSWLFV